MKKMKKKLVPAIEYAIQNPKISITKVSEIFEVDRHALSKYKKNNLYLEYKYENQSDKNDDYLYSFSDEEIKFVDLYLSNPSTPYDQLRSQIKEAPERRTLYHWLSILGKEKTEGGSIKYHYNRTRFGKIETEEDAYWLGFITADGCIIDGKWLQIQLAEKDKEHLIKFGKYMGLNKDEISEIIKDGFGGAYTRDNPVNNMKICSIEIIDNLKDKGITPRKSEKEKPYICQTKDLELAYIRGLIDGDGYIGSTQKRMGIVGSYDICEYVQNYINENIKDISNNHIREHGTIYKLEINGAEQTPIILKALYENANIYLDRKYQLYNDLYKPYCRD